MRSAVLPPTLLRHLRRLGSLLLAAGLVLGALVAARPALAAGETVNIWLTTTNDSGGRNVDPRPAAAGPDRVRLRERGSAVRSSP